MLVQLINPTCLTFRTEFEGNLFFFEIFLLGSQSQYSWGQLIFIVAFHSSIIKSIIRHYTGWTLDNLATKTRGIQSNASPTKSEILMARAPYRFQLYYSLFSVSIGFDYVDNLRIFQGRLRRLHASTPLLMKSLAKFLMTFPRICAQRIQDLKANAGP